MPKKIKGIVPPITTPFKEDGEFYEKGMRNIVSWLIDKGVHGLFATGSYGSFALMNQEERQQVAEVILDENNGRVAVAVHVGSSSSQETVKLAKHAESIGADAVACVIPFYYSAAFYHDYEILHHFEQVVKAVDIPVWLYHNPKTTGFTASAELVKKLAKLGVTGLKDSGGDLMLFGDFINKVKEVNPDFTAMVGTVGLLYPAMLFGAPGCVAGTANVFPELVIELYDRIIAKDYQRAKELQLQVIEIRKIQGITGFRPAGCYAAYQMRGLDAGTARSPWRLPNAEERRQMEKRFKEIGLLA